MKNYFIIFGICTALASKVGDLMIKMNIVQVVKREEWNPKTQRYEVVELYPQRVNPWKGK